MSGDDYLSMLSKGYRMIIDEVLNDEVDEAEGRAPGDVGDAGAQDQEDPEGVPTLRGTDGASGHRGEGEASAVREADGREALGEEVVGAGLSKTLLELAEDIGGDGTANGRDLADFALVAAKMEKCLVDLQELLDIESESHAQTYATFHRTEQGLQAQIADLLRENGMLKNELRAKDGTIRILQSRRGL